MQRFGDHAEVVAPRRGLDGGRSATAVTLCMITERFTAVAAAPPARVRL
jgi:hypothetical protein